MKRFRSQAKAAILSAAILPALLCNAATQESCKFTEAGIGKVASVRDGRTLLLADGRELRLAAIEVADESRSLLQSLVGGRDVRLKQPGPQQDRYGRLVAFVYVDDSQQSIQQTMLERGTRVPPWALG